MTLALDHVVIAVDDLARASADYAALGFTVLPGGAHANGITYNALVVLADGAYLELIAWHRPDPGNRWSDLRFGPGPGFVDYALLPHDTAAVVAAARGRGLDLGDPEPGGRLRPDGARLEWQTARSPGPDVPFLCGDVTPRALRVPEGAGRSHPNGVTGVSAITVAVHDLRRSVARVAALLGASAAGEAAGTVAGTPAETATFDLAGETQLVLAAPLGEGPLAEALARGEGPFALALRGGAPGDLDPARTGGPRIATGG